MKSKENKTSRKSGAVAASRMQREPVISRSDMLEAVLKANEKLQSTLSRYFQVPVTSLPQPDQSRPLLERKLILRDYVLDLYNKHISTLNRRAYNYKGSDNSESDYLTEKEKHEFILNLPKILADINSTLSKLKKENPKHIQAVHLTVSMSLVIATMFRLFDSCITSMTVRPEYLSIIDEAIDFYEQYGESTFCVKFDDKRGYASRKVYSYTTACVLYHNYLNVYLTLKESGYPVPSEEVFLQHAKKFKMKQIEYVKAVPGEQFVPNPDFKSQYFSLFNYYSALVNFYEKNTPKFVHFLDKMMEAKEDFNILSANGAIFEKISDSLNADDDLKHHLLLLSLGLKIIDNHFNYYQSLDEESRQRAKFGVDWLYQGIESVELEQLNLSEIREKYYSRYVETVLMLAAEQAISLEGLVKQLKLNSFIEKVSVQVHSNVEHFDVHDVYAELDLRIKDERFMPIIMEQLDRMNVSYRLSDALTLSIEASFFEIPLKSLKAAFLKMGRLCRNVERKHLEQLRKEENDKMFAMEQLKKEEQHLVEDKELPKVDELKREESEKVDEKKGEESEKIDEEKEKKKEMKKIVTSHQHKEKSKTKHLGREKEAEFSKQQGSFFNPRQPKAAPPVFKNLPEGARMHKLRKPDSPCKYWVCIHPCLVREMTREHKTLELNRLHSQLREGSLGKGQGVRGIIEGETLKWADPSRNCRYYGLAADEYHDQSGKHVLFMLTTKVDEHSKKTPNIIVPPELKEKDSKQIKRI